MNNKRLYLLLSILFISTSAYSQSLTDGVRLSLEPLGTGARSISMGGTGITNANDYSALAWNPAALMYVNSDEMNFSLFYKDHSSTASYLGSSLTQNLTNFNISSFAYASAVPTTRGHLAFGFSVDRDRDYNMTYKFSAVNPTSSLFDTKGFVLDPGFDPRNETFSDYLYNLQNNNIAWQLYLTHGLDTTTPRLTTPFANGGLLQTGTVTQQGGLYAIRLGGAIDVAPNISLGATLNYFTGSFDYRRVYTESDVNNVFSRTDSNPPGGFKSATITDTRHQTQDGFSLKLGFLATPNEHVSFGLTVETPQVFAIIDKFQRTGSSKFNFASYSTLDPKLDVQDLNAPVQNDYTLTTPLRVGGGLSLMGWGATVSVAASYSDYSQMRYSEASTDLSDLNDAARNDLGGVLTWKVGAEYVFKPIGLMLRGGFSSEPSAYKSDPTNYGITCLTFGLGLLLSPSVITELSYKQTSNRTDHLVYGGQNTAGSDVQAIVNQDDVVTSQVMLSFSFRW
ncbi:MAG: hypothetical protein WCH46_11020 [bacterium]